MTMTPKPPPPPDRRWAIAFTALAAVGALGGPAAIAVGAVAAVPFASVPFPHTRFIVIVWGVTVVLSVPLYARLGLRNARRSVPDWLRVANHAADAVWIAGGTGVAATNESTHWLGGRAWTVVFLIPFGLFLLGLGNVIAARRRRGA